MLFDLGHSYALLLICHKNSVQQVFTLWRQLQRHHTSAEENSSWLKGPADMCSPPVGSMGATEGSLQQNSVIDVGLEYDTM